MISRKIRTVLFPASLLAVLAVTGMDAGSARLNAAGPTPLRISTERLISIAKTYERQGRYDQAASIYESIIAREPDHVEANRAIEQLMSAPGQPTSSATSATARTSAPATANPRNGVGAAKRGARPATTPRGSSLPARSSQPSPAPVTYSQRTPVPVGQVAPPSAQPVEFVPQVAPTVEHQPPVSTVQAAPSTQPVPAAQPMQVARPYQTIRPATPRVDDNAASDGSVAIQPRSTAPVSQSENVNTARPLARQETAEKAPVSDDIPLMPRSLPAQPQRAAAPTAARELPRDYDRRSETVDAPRQSVPAAEQISPVSQRQETAEPVFSSTSMPSRQLRPSTGLDAFDIEILDQWADAPEKYVDPLIRMLKHTEPEKRCYAVFLLGRAGKEASKALPDLRRELRIETGAMARVRIAEAIYRIHGPDDMSLKEMIDQLRGGDAEVRSTSARVLALAKDSPRLRFVIENLADSLRDEDTSVGRAAAYTLATFGEDSKLILPDLFDAAKSIDPNLRAAARTAISKIDPDLVLPAE